MKKYIISIIFRLFVLSIILTAAIPRFSFCQDNSQNDSDSDIVINIKAEVNRLSDSLLSVEKTFTDSLLLGLKVKSGNSEKRFASSADSISHSVEDSLILARKDSLRLVSSSFQKNIIRMSESLPLNLTMIPAHYSAKVSSIKNTSFDDESDVLDTLNIINEEFKDSLTSSVNDYYDNLNDYVDNAVDSLGNYSQTLVDNQNDENDLLDSLRDLYYSYGFFAKVGYTSDMQYRGYKGAAPQSALFPGLFYNHPIGLGAFFNAYNIAGTGTAWDEIEIGASYTRNFNDKFSMCLSYTHYNFNDTSETSKQGLTGIAGLNFNYEFPLLAAGFSFQIGFGDQTDYSIIPNLSKRIEFTKNLKVEVWFEPDFSGVYGTESLLNTRIIRRLNAKKKIVKNVKTTSSKVFSVLDYELALPVNVEFGRFIITPEYDYSIPLNQPLNIDSNPFGFFTINVSCKIL